MSKELDSKLKAFSEKHGFEISAEMICHAGFQVQKCQEINAGIKILKEGKYCGTFKSFDLIQYLEDERFRACQIAITVLGEKYREILRDWAEFVKVKS